MLKEILNSIETKRKVICITGGLAEGKTLAMSVLVNELQQELGASSFTNYGIANGLTLKLREHASHFMAADEYEIISIDEGASVFAFSRNFMDHFLSDHQKEKNSILFFNSSSLAKIPRESRKKIDIHLKVEKDGENGEIKVSGVNVPYERTLLIEESIGYYNAFQDVDYYL